MIELFEKTLWGLTGLALLCLGGAFYFLGTPSVEPLIAVEAVERRQEDFVNALNQGARKDLEDQLAEGLQRVSTSGSSQAGRAGTPSRQFKQINRAMYKRLETRNDALYEAKQVSSDTIEVNGKAALQLLEIPESSPLRKLGFEPNDVITSVGNFDIDFSSAASADKAFEQAKRLLESGGALVITYQRGARNRTQQIAISLSDL